MSLADSVDEGDLSPYELFDDWEAVEAHQRRCAREERGRLDDLMQRHMDLEMRYYVAHEMLKVTLAALDIAIADIAHLERRMDYEAWRDAQWAQP